jgi:hypothetical protein
LLALREPGVGRERQDFVVFGQREFLICDGDFSGDKQNAIGRHEYSWGGGLIKNGRRKKKTENNRSPIGGPHTHLNIRRRALSRPHRHYLFRGNPTRPREIKSRR